MEPILMNHTDILESFTWIPFDMKRLDEAEIIMVLASDFIQDKQFKMGTYAVQPSFIDLVDKRFLDVYS